MSVSEWTKQDKLTNVFFFFNDTATTEIYTLSLHDALPISRRDSGDHLPVLKRFGHFDRRGWLLLVAMLAFRRSEEHTSELQSRQYLVCRLLLEKKKKFTTISYITSFLITLSSFYHRYYFFI